MLDMTRVLAGVSGPKPGGILCPAEEGRLTMVCCIAVLYTDIRRSRVGMVNPRIGPHETLLLVLCERH